jgi:hypothetical protein
MFVEKVYFTSIPTKKHIHTSHYVFVFMQSHHMMNFNQIWTTVSQLPLGPYTALIFTLGERRRAREEKETLTCSRNTSCWQWSHFTLPFGHDAICFCKQIKKSINNLIKNKFPTAAQLKKD